jgi:hypothetical protein
VLLTVLLAVGCGDDDAGTTATTVAPPTTTTAPAPPTTYAEGEPFDASFRLVGDPDFMAVGDGALWVKGFASVVYRIDPDTNQVAAAIDLDRAAECDGIGAADGAVWACTDEGVVPIDPATNEPGDVVEVQKVADQGVLPVVGDQVWILTGDGSAIVPVTRDGVGDEFDLGVRCTQPSVGETATIWIACPPDETVIEFDPESGQVVTTVAGLADPRSVAATDTDVWVVTGDGLVHVDAATGDVVGTAADAETNPVGGVAALGPDVWLRANTNLLQRVDPTSLEVTDTVDAAVGPGGSVQIAFGSVWATAYDDATLYRLPLGG